MIKKRMNTFSIPIIIINLYFYFIIFYKTSKITRNKKHETKNTKQETRPLTKKKKRSHSLILMFRQGKYYI